MTGDAALAAALTAEIGTVLAAHEAPDAQFALAYGGRVIAQGSCGAVDDSSLFCAFSASKPVFASLILQLIGQKELSLDTRIVDLWPEFGAHGKGDITLEHLLLHTAAIPGWFPVPPAVFSRSERARQAEGLVVEWTPGYGTGYHSVSAHWVMAEIVMRVTGKDYRAALRQRILDPLGLERIRFGVPVFDSHRPRAIRRIGEPRPEQFTALFGAAVSLADVIAAEEAALAHAENAEVIALGTPGAGMITDAASLALFYQALLHDPRGVWDGGLLRIATTEVRNALPEPSRAGASANRAVGGFVVAGNERTVQTIPEIGMARPVRWFGTRVSDRTFGHRGAGGQLAFADPDRGLSFVFLTSDYVRDVVQDERRALEIADVVIDVFDAH
ncbi:serine hydrolase domain-containing protein [Microbacterium gorillae]|uniref:serine hydrolase domain-containing protein n=1 Tax=Microbacterium gorillae TaxID=1231063 RepID=UPI003D95307A